MIGDLNFVVIRTGETMKITHKAERSLNSIVTIKYVGSEIFVYTVNEDERSDFIDNWLFEPVNQTEIDELSRDIKKSVYSELKIEEYLYNNGWRKMEDKL